jgi:DNA replicative helicase MCM subunit Mcm2 (Cdc46/Mcm family)
VSDIEQQSHGGPPKILDVEVTRDMVSGCACGDDVSMIGYVRVSKGESSSKLQNGVMTLHIEALSLLNHNRSDIDIIQVCVVATSISACSPRHTTACVLNKIVAGAWLKRPCTSVAAESCTMLFLSGTSVCVSA